MRRRTFLHISTSISAVTATGLLGARPALAAPRPDVVISPDGPGLQAAIDAVPAGQPLVIGLRPGAYRGQVIIPADKPHLELRGLGRHPEDVLIADDRANGTLKPDGTPWGTSGSASVTIDSPDLRAVNLTFANLFDEAANPQITNRQAVAVLTRADRLVFDRVRFLGNQDTLYVNSRAAGVIARAYFRDCYIEGDVDFIFGRATAVFDRSRIHSLNRASTPAGYVTAPSTDLTNPHGLLFTRCRFTSDAPAGSVFLGRPWHPGNDPNAVGQTIIRDSWLGPHIPATAWSDFGTWPWRSAGRFAEQTATEAAQQTPTAFLQGTDAWAPHCR
jgi:pectinesterase